MQNQFNNGQRPVNAAPVAASEKKFNKDFMKGAAAGSAATALVGVTLWGVKTLIKKIKLRKAAKAQAEPVVEETTK